MKHQGGQNIQQSVLRFHVVTPTVVFYFIGCFVGRSYNLPLIKGFRRAVPLCTGKGADSNAEAEREFRYCTAIALKHPYKAVLALSQCTSSIIFYH